MDNNAPVPNESGGAHDEAREGVGEAARDFSSWEFLPDLAGEVADLAVCGLAGVAGGLLARVVGVEVPVGGGARAGGVDGVDVDVERWGGVSWWLKGGGGGGVSEKRDVLKGPPSSGSLNWYSMSAPLPPSAPVISTKPLTPFLFVDAISAL